MIFNPGLKAASFKEAGVYMKDKREKRMEVYNHALLKRFLTKFQVSVKDVFFMQVPQSRDNLSQIIPHLWLSKHFACLQDMG